MAALGGLIVLIMLVLLLFFTHWIKSGNPISIRPIRALQNLPFLTSQAVESGQKIHVSVGTGGISDIKTASTLAGLATLDYLAERGCGSGSPPSVTIADPMVLPAAQDSLRRAYVHHNRPDEFKLTQAEMIAPQPFAYATGAFTRLNSENIIANVMLGSFGPEVLLMAESGEQMGATQIAGADNPEAMAMLIATVDEPIIGEEIFAVSAYLNHLPAHLASLRTQDVMRLGIVAIIIIASLIRTIGLF
ncbi:MAG: hypothetical protein JXA42_01660 [Anaerolineales bacterium]|nr:hypothetical protein [Anaerolineales bacterium]